MYLLFLFLRAHSRRRVERMYWSGVSLNSLTACSKEVTTGMTGPMGSGLPQLGLPRRLAIVGFALPFKYKVLTSYDLHLWIPKNCLWFQYLMKKQAWIDLTLEPKARCKTVHYRRLFSYLQRLFFILSRFFFVFFSHSRSKPSSCSPDSPPSILITIPSPTAVQFSTVYP